MYAEIFIGLRSYYARYPNRRKDAGFHAAMTMSFLFSVASVSAFVLVDYGLHGILFWADAVFSRKFFMLLIGAAVAFTHVFYGRYVDQHASAAPSSASRWKAYVFAYAGVAGVLLAGAISVAFMS